MKIRNREEAMGTQLNMTSMIDIVFLLLIFFVMTFKIVELAGADRPQEDPAAARGREGVEQQRQDREQAGDRRQRLGHQSPPPVAAV